MKYTIFSIDNRRSEYIDNLRIGLAGWTEVDTECVNGADPQQLAAAMERHPYDINWPAKVGQLGIWYTVLNAMDHAPIITFEDDAMLEHLFHANFTVRQKYIPEDFDFFSLFLARNNDHMWTPDRTVNQFVTKTYQRYGGVSMYYSEQGVQKIKALLERDGLTGQYDDTLYAYSKAGELNGYCSRPDQSDLVYITGTEPSIVQESEFYE